MDSETGKEQVQNEKLERAKSWLDEQVQDLANSAPSLHLIIRLYRKGDENEGERPMEELGYGRYLGIDTQKGTLQVRKFVPEDNGHEGFRDTGENIEFNLTDVSQISSRNSSIVF